jgi:formylglycine-generating enzyme required for sulfatase activity
VIRGGGWGRWIDWDDPLACRSANRFYGPPDGRRFIIGFRVVVVQGQP